MTLLNPPRATSGARETAFGRFLHSADGHSFETAWHHGPESDEIVYVEIRRRHDRSFHGWVDAESRKIVQAG